MDLIQENWLKFSHLMTTFLQNQNVLDSTRKRLVDLAYKRIEICSQDYKKAEMPEMFSKAVGYQFLCCALGCQISVDDNRFIIEMPLSSNEDRDLLVDAFSCLRTMGKDYTIDPTTFKVVLTPLKTRGT